MATSLAFRESDHAIVSLFTALVQVRTGVFESYSLRRVCLACQQEFRFLRFVRRGPIFTASTGVSLISIATCSACCKHSALHSVPDKFPYWFSILYVFMKHWTLYTNLIAAHCIFSHGMVTV